MNRDDIIRMAHEAQGEALSHGMWSMHIEDLERFAALVAAAEREAYQHVHRLLEVHQAALEASEKPGPWPAKEVIAKAVAAEREACARVCDEFSDPIAKGYLRNVAVKIKAAIRARGEE